MRTDEIQALQTDVLVVGAGAAGVAAAVTAARKGLDVILVESGAMPGGELLTGMAIDGALNGRGEWVVGGFITELLEECRRLGGYIGALNDWRLIHYVCYDPEIMKLAVANLLGRHSVRLLLHTFAYDVEHTDAQVRSVHILNKQGRTRITAAMFIDASGDGDIAAMAGASYLSGDNGQYQPLSLMFRLANVDTPALLDFLAREPEHFALGESDAIRGGRSDQQIAQEVKKQGYPTVFLKGDGPLMANAIEAGELYPTALIMIQPTSSQKREVCLNTTRVANVDATRTRDLSAVLEPLSKQIEICTNFMRHRVPGFEQTVLSGLAQRIGIRETRRIACDEVLTQDDVLSARKRKDAIGKGSHHVDIHEAGIGQLRIPVEGGGSYDIPFGCLLPKG
ncbi:MAG TPA: FAD-dependent oxidoreductase, partial [Advenella sp.]|nr:FAD-dependent oxidoreductase [Advenella sp.]